MSKSNFGVHVVAWLSRQRLVANNLVNRFASWLLHSVLVHLASSMTAWRLRRGSVRTLWGISPILTLPLKARADRLLGFKSSSVVFTTYYITSAFDLNLSLVTRAVYKLVPGWVPAYHRLLLGWLMLRYDVFHFFFDRGIMRSASPRGFGIAIEELSALRKAGKRVYGFAYGADVRLRDRTLALGGWNFCKECPEPREYCICDDANGAKVLDEICAMLTAPVALGDMLAYVPKARNIHYWPIDVAALPPPSRSRVEGGLRIAHAPNHTHFKGSQYLEAAIEKLQKAGKPVEYRKVQGVPNTEVMSIFSEADVIADQFIGGAFGYTALEAMALGKPVLTFVRSPDLVEAADECPLINVTPERIEDALLWLIDNRASLPRIGAQGAAYVRRWHSIEAVAEKLGWLYETTAELPKPIVEKIRAQRRTHLGSREAIVCETDWDHPFTVNRTVKDSSSRWAEAAALQSRTDALAVAKQPVEERWRALAAPSLRSNWHSYDRTPWRHPWLTSENIGAFRSFSAQTFDKLRSASMAGSRKHGFVGNIGNINYTRMNGLVKYGIDISLYLPEGDQYPMSQPAWEDSADQFAAVDADTSSSIMAVPLPPKVFRPKLNYDWPAQIRAGEGHFISARNLVRWADLLCYLPMLEQLQDYDSLLVSQVPYVGLMSSRPFIFGPIGGEIWFEAAREDALGQITREALRRAYAIIVSNPITLAQGRRYGLSNLLHLPYCIDETKYAPGEAPDVRAEWEEQVGGSFFALISMRLDNHWKGARVAIEGFAAAARANPEIRLVVLGWGTDESAVRPMLTELGVADRVVLAPVVGKTRLVRLLQAADAFIEQFVLGYYGASGLEAMGCGLPVIMRLEHDQYEALSNGGAPPVLNASTSEEVSRHLLALAGDRRLRESLRRDMRDWFLRSHAAAACADGYRTLLSAAACGLAIDWSQSPLAAPESSVERTYHQTQLRNAPNFPAYEIEPSV